MHTPNGPTRRYLPASEHRNIPPDVLVLVDLDDGNRYAGRVDAFNWTLRGPGRPVGFWLLGIVADAGDAVADVLVHA